MTNINTNDMHASESYFPTMDPICLTNLCKTDLEKWSINKDNESYLTVHQDGPFPLSDDEPFSSENIRDSICVYRERMAKDHIRNQMLSDINTSSKLVKFHVSTSFGKIVPSTKQLFQKLRAYRRRLATKCHHKTKSEKLSQLEQELTATLELVQQKLQEQNLREEGKMGTTSSSSSKHSLCSRASSLYSASVYSRGLEG